MICPSLNTEKRLNNNNIVNTVVINNGVEEPMSISDLKVGDSINLEETIDMTKTLAENLLKTRIIKLE